MFDCLHRAIARALSQKCVCLSARCDRVKPTQRVIECTAQAEITQVNENENYFKWQK